MNKWNPSNASGALRFIGENLDFIINYDIKYRMGDALMEGAI